ncbi:MAG: Na/Pi cotransporter family protein [Phycisphaerales bacterium]|nr:Na/Pi cotransporter family protein [Phycisphaerales bacterium]
MPPDASIASLADLPLWSIISLTLGGLALFLYGLELMTNGLKRLAGARLKSWLARLTTTRLRAVAAGALITGVVQSSSVTTVLVVGFVSAGVMTLSQAVGVIMGANIGTTITGQMIAFKVTEMALVPVVLGFVCHAAAPSPAWRQVGRLVLGMGLIFLGMQFMGEGAEPLSRSRAFMDLMANLRHPLPALMVGLVITALVQSSSATTGIVIVLASGGLITLETGVAIILGANVGTCVTAMLASIGRTREAVRTALIHVIFNLAGALIWVFMIRWLAALAALLSSDVARQIANAQTIFNVANTLLFIGFTGPLASLVRLLVPDRPVTDASRARYLDDILLLTPDMALDAAGRELARLGDVVMEMLRHARTAVVMGRPADLERLPRLDAQVDELHAAILDYLRQLATRDISQAQSSTLRELISASNDLEHMGDTVATLLHAAGRGRLESAITLSADTLSHIDRVIVRVMASVEDALAALATRDVARAEAVLASEAVVARLASECGTHLVRRLAAPDPDRLPHYLIETDIVDGWRRIHYFAGRLARLVLEPLNGDAGGQTPPEPVQAN